MRFSVEIENDVDTLDEVAQALALAGVVMALVQCMQAMGLTREEGIARAGAAVAAAWPIELHPEPSNKPRSPYG